MSKVIPLRLRRSLPYCLVVPRRLVPPSLLLALLWSLSASWFSSKHQKISLAAYATSTMVGFCAGFSAWSNRSSTEKLFKLLNMLGQATKMPKLSARFLASIVGRIVSMGLAVGPASRFMTRSLYAVLESRQMWCGMLTLSEEAKNELDFWSASLTDYKM